MRITACSREVPGRKGLWKETIIILTQSRVQSPSWAADWFAASQEIPRISRNPKVHYRTHKRPPPVSILGQPNAVHIPTSHLLEIHPNIIHPSRPRPPQWSLSHRFPHQDPIHTPLLSHTRKLLLTIHKACTSMTKLSRLLFWRLNHVTNFLSSKAHTFFYQCK